MGKEKESLEFYNKSLDAAARQYGAKNPYVAEIQYKIGTVSLELGKNEDAKVALSEAVSIRTETLGKNHPKTLESLKLLGTSLVLTNNVNDAIENLKDALSASVALFGQ